MADAKRLTGLKVKEISLVDSPAIVEEFIVTKRNETGTPAPVAKNADGTDASATPAEPTTTEKAEPVAEGEGAGAGSSMPLHEALIAEKIAAVQIGLTKLAADIASGTADADAARERMWGIQDLLWGICSAAAAVQVTKSADGNPMEAAATVQKARDGMKVAKAADPAAEDDKPAKAPGMKKFTKSRVEKLANGLAAIHEVLQEVAPGDVQKALSALADGNEEPGNGDTNSVPTPPTAAPVAKSTEPSPEVAELRTELQKARDETATATAAASDLSKRLDALEKMGISKAAGGDAVATEQKKSTWAGLV